LVRWIGKRFQRATLLDFSILCLLVLSVSCGGSSKLDGGSSMVDGGSDTVGVDDCHHS
jgi:hypothetical protein